MSAALHGPQRSASFDELEVVAITRDTKTDAGMPVRAGTLATVVGVWADGLAYEVEFEAPAGTATMKPEDLARASAA